MLWYDTTRDYLRGDQSHLFEQQAAEFTRVHDSARHNDPARDLAIGADDSVYVLMLPRSANGVDRGDLDYELFRWNGLEFDRVEGEGVAVAVDPDGEPWLVRNDGTIRRRVAGAWETVPGTARDISVGADGAVWAVGTESVEDGYAVLRWTGSAWERIDRGATRIAVAPDGEPWITTDSGFIFRRLAGRWHRLPNAAIDIAFGADGNCWIAGMDGGRHGGNSVYRYNGREWDKIDGATIRVGATSNGMVWLINIRGGVYPRQLSQ